MVKIQLVKEESESIDGDIVDFEENSDSCSIAEKAENNDNKIIDDLIYDVYNLTACHYHPVGFQSTEESLRIEAQRVTQLLFKRYRMTYDFSTIISVLINPILINFVISD
jgi:hypothetical protein